MQKKMLRYYFFRTSSQSHGQDLFNSVTVSRKTKTCLRVHVQKISVIQGLMKRTEKPQNIDVHNNSVQFATNDVHKSHSFITITEIPIQNSINPFKFRAIRLTWCIRYITRNSIVSTYLNGQTWNIYEL